MLSQQAKKITNIFFDIDYTLLDFEIGHQAAIDLLTREYNKTFSLYFDKIFQVILEIVRSENPNKAKEKNEFFNEITRKMSLLQNSPEPKIWSRELYAVLAGQYAKISLSAPQCIKIADQYWEAVNKNSILYPDARSLIDKLNKRKTPYHLFSSSDYRLVWRNNRWEYEPKYSKDKKIVRITALRAKNILPRSVTIGDPIDKPDLAFYRMMLDSASKALGTIVDPSECLITGDSYIGDVEAPVRKAGFKLGFLIKRDGISGKLSESIYCINNLLEIDV